MTNVREKIGEDKNLYGIMWFDYKFVTFSFQTKNWFHIENQFYLKSNISSLYNAIESILKFIKSGGHN
jgi:hypothetical protein